MAPRLPSEDPVFVLDRDHVHGVDVEEIGGACIGAGVVVRQLEADASRIGVGVLPEIDSNEPSDGETDNVGAVTVKVTGMVNG